MNAVVSKHITKRYGTVEALKGIDLEVEAGELFGIIGADGAGKTTLFRILTTLLLADEGEASVDGLDVVTQYKLVRSRIGYMPGRFSLYPDLSVQENLEFFASVFGTTIEENYALIEPIYKQIAPFKTRRSGKLSGGMKQKLALCCALIHRPTVLFLDEPTTGVDPVSRKEFWEMLRQLKLQGITIVVSTPYMDEANLCDRIALMRLGEFLKVDTPRNIIHQFGESLWAAKSQEMYHLLMDIRSFPEVRRCYTFGPEHHFTLEDTQVEPLKRYLREKGHQVEINAVTASIEDCYMQLEGKNHG